MATIRDVAKRAGVAISTVSLALNGTGPVGKETRDKIIQAASELGYSPSADAQSLRRGHNKLIALVTSDINDPLFGRMLRAVDKVVSQAEHTLITADTCFDPDREIQILAQLQRHRVAGVIMAPTNNTPEFATLLRNTPVPVVLYDKYVGGAKLDYVTTDNELTTRMVTEYLIRLGHRRISYLGGPSICWNAQLRLAGFRSAMETAAIPIEPEFEILADAEGERAYQHVTRLMSRPDRPSAIVASTSLMALGALQAINDLGFTCPQDISLVGVDDVPWGSVIKPRVTTAVQPVDELAGIAARWLLERISTRGGATLAPRTHVAVPRLIIGQSCARI